MNEPPERPEPDEIQQPSLLESRPSRSRDAADDTPPQRRVEQARERAPREDRRESRERGRGQRQASPSGPPPPREPRAVRGQSGGEVSLKTIALIAFVFGVFLHGCVAWSFLDDEGLPTEPDRQNIVVTSTAVPQTTQTPTPLPDRTTCEEIRGTDYRSDAERDFFRRNCITSAAPGGLPGQVDG